MFALIISALGVVLGGIFIGWVAMHFLGERNAKYVVASLALVAVLTELDFETFEARMQSIGLLVGSAVLLAALFRPRNRRPIVERQ
ncbi:MAG TPA: hypothetical protein VFS49_09115 [Croceibacterium sp.]|nr:hypothetical protein [Croceibacterium sp.]